MNIIKTRIQRLYFTELSTLVDSKVNIVNAAKIMAENIANKKLIPVCEEIRLLIAKGATLSDSLEKHPNIFTPWQINIVRYSEKAGRLAEGLQRINTCLDKDYTVQRRLLVNSLYPFFLLNIAIFFIPITTLISLGIGPYLLTILKYIFLLYVPVVLVVFSKKIFTSLNLQRAYDNLILNIPLISKINRQFLILSFIRSLESLCKSGVNIIQAWKISSLNSTNIIVKEALLKGLPYIEEGEELKVAFSKTNIFSNKIIGMIAAGEAGGSIGKMLANIADFYEKDNDLTTSILSKILPVVFYLAVAAMIGIKIILFYLNYFSQVFSF